MAAIFLRLACGALGPARPLELTLSEELSVPTVARVTVLVDDAPEPDDVLGSPALLELGLGDEVVRSWHLVVTSLAFLGHRLSARSYALGLHHELGLLAYRSNVRPFQELDVKGIVTEVLRQAGIPAEHTGWKAKRTTPKRAYCVQYRETDLDFVSRLLAHEGIFFYVDEGASPPPLTFADDTSALGPVAGDGMLPLVQEGADNGVRWLELAYASTPDEVALNDWNEELPHLDFYASATAAGDECRGALYEFPGGYATPDEGRALATLRAEALAASKQVAQGGSDCMALRPGAWFTLTESPRETLATQHLVRRVTHLVRTLSSGAPGDRHVYDNDFVCSPFKQPYRPHRRVPEPRVQGSHSVLVAGPSGEEIYTDELGRMKAKPFWDKTEPQGDQASRWVRVAQLPLGGTQTLARVGWEMAVQYVYGNPDRPVAVARLDNGGHPAPYGYPAAASAMALKTHSSPGGGGANEVTLEDSVGRMGFSLNASRDYSEQTNNNKAETVAVNETCSVGTDLQTTIGANQTVTVGATLRTQVGADATLGVGVDRTLSVGAAETLSVSGGMSEKVSSSDAELVGASHVTAAGLGVSKTCMGSHSLTVGGSMLSAAGLGCAVAVAGAKAETIGGAKIVASGGPINETVIGAAAVTVGGAIVNAAGGNRMGSAGKSSTLNVGGVVLVNAAGQVQLKAKTITINVAGLANVLGGGAILNLTPGSASFVGLVTVSAEGAIKLSGAPNFAGT
jgi:type VI secretion system secreted protein VgrG